jgi:glycosyltransferase involved in cell wall biosynthesis
MAKKIIIGIDIRDLKISKTGARTYLEELYKEFKKEDGDFLFVFIDTPFPVYTGKNKVLKLAEQFRFLFWKQCTLPLIACFKKCDIVFCTDYFVPYFHPGFITIPVFHDAFFWEYPDQYNPYWLSLFHMLGVSAAKRSPLVVTPTRYTQKQIAAFSGIPESKIIPVYEAPKPLAATTKVSVMATMEKDLSFPYLLHVGTFEKRKNLSVLIEAFSQLVSGQYPDLKLLLIGQPSPKKPIDDSETIHQLILEKNLQDKVLLPGYVSDELLHFYYKHALIYVFPSRNEGFGIPVLEAFMYGLPVLIANNSCLPEIAGDAAISFDPDNIKDLKDTINELLTNHKLREEMAEKGTNRLKHFSWEKTAAELKVLFKAAYLAKQK